jgi:putative peptide zinc metalloprotease protein
MTTTPGSLELFRPEIRADVIFGPPVVSGGKRIYYVKDKLTGWFYRIGAREYFLMQKMDGQKTIPEIEAEYLAAFHQQLTERSWTQLFALLGKRALLVGNGHADRLGALAQEAQVRRSARGRSLLNRRFSLPGPDRFLARLLPWVRFAFHPVFVSPALVLIGLLELFFAFNARSAVIDLFGGLQHYLSVPFVLLLCLFVGFFLAVHEIAHGLACKYFGGSVQEIGITLRGFLPFAYCKIDDVVLFHNRWHRVSTAFAGIFVNLLMIIPFACLWQFSPAQSLTRVIGAFVLVFMNIFILLNCLPFGEADGYLMLSYALNMVDLRQHAYRVWQFRKRDKAISYTGTSRLVYLVYGFCSLVFLLALCAGAVLLIILLLRRFL